MAPTIGFYGDAIIRDRNCQHNCGDCDISVLAISYLDSLLREHPSSEILNWNINEISQGDTICVLVTAQMRTK